MGQEFELRPVTVITTDAIGKPGERVFYIQGRKNDEVITLLVEKIQIQTLALGVEEFMEEIQRDHPDLTPALDLFDESKMHITPPVDPLFRIGELALAYDSSADLVCLVAREILTGSMEAEDAQTVRFWATRAQLKGMVKWGLEVTGRGRAICPQCGEPMDPAGHFCPKKNGHKH